MPVDPEKVILSLVVVALGLVVLARSVKPPFA